MAEAATKQTEQAITNNIDIYTLDTIIRQSENSTNASSTNETHVQQSRRKPISDRDLETLNKPNHNLSYTLHETYDLSKPGESLKSNVALRYCYSQDGQFIYLIHEKDKDITRINRKTKNRHVVYMPEENETITHIIQLTKAQDIYNDVSLFAVSLYNNTRTFVRFFVEKGDEFKKVGNDLTLYDKDVDSKNKREYAYMDELPDGGLVIGVWNHLELKEFQRTKGSNLAFELKKSYTLPYGFQRLCVCVCKRCNSQPSFIVTTTFDKVLRIWNLESSSTQINLLKEYEFLPLTFKFCPNAACFDKINNMLYVTNSFYYKNEDIWISQIEMFELACEDNNHYFCYIGPIIDLQEGIQYNIASITITKVETLDEA